MIGHKQADRVAEFLGSEVVHHVLCSPYLRTIQTAEKIAMRLSHALKIESGICETNPRPVADLRERVRYFPCVDVRYESLHQPTVPEPFPEGLLARCQIAVRRIVERFPTENLVLVTHAATALMMASSLLVGDRAVTLADTALVAPIGPCGVFRLERAGPGCEWRVVQNAHSEHVSDLTGVTRAWHPLEATHNF
jgi:broad specificity phosphatase PhoE